MTSQHKGFMSDAGQKVIAEIPDSIGTFQKNTHELPQAKGCQQHPERAVMRVSMNTLAPASESVAGADVAVDFLHQKTPACGSRGVHEVDLSAGEMRKTYPQGKPNLTNDLDG
jgi:hypothetical protein